MKQLEFDFATMMNIEREASELVDICGGPMTPKEIVRETEFYLRRNPDYLVVTSERRKDGKYQTTIYVDSNNFRNPKHLNTLVS